MISNHVRHKPTQKDLFKRLTILEVTARVRHVSQGIRSLGSGHRMSSFDRCQLTEAWMSNMKDVRYKPRLNDLSTYKLYMKWQLEYDPHLARHLRCGAPGIHVASHDKHEKRVAWFSFCMCACGFVFSYGTPLGELSGHRNSAIICNVSLISPCVRRINREVLTRESELEFCFGGSNSWDMHVPVIICFWIAFYTSGFLHRSSYLRKNHNSPFLINNVKIQPKTLDLSMWLLGINLTISVVILQSLAMKVIV